ncbi:hypothetical protein [Marilutibacter maris]|uniref:hypothetical protein n=1 Tax=Marilutibacter maris TaxID=1605891 RepID=UPI001CB93558|nr:hypothetical protein [Lysobacter maris]
MSHLQHLSIYAISRLVFVLVEQLPNDGGTIIHGRRRDRPVTAGQLEKAAQILNDWPHAFQRHLADRYAEAVQGDIFGSGFRSAFYWALHTLDNAKQASATSEFAFLKEQIYCFGAKYLPRERLVRGDRVRLPVSNAWGTILEAAAEIGMDPRTLIKRVKSGEVPAIQADYQRRNRNLLVDMEWLRRWKVSRYAPVHVRDAAETIGISVSLLLASREVGIYESRHHARRAKGFSEEDVASFAKVLLRLAKRYSVDGTPGGITENGVNLRTTKSIVRRIELLRDLKQRHHEMWAPDESRAETSGKNVEVEVSGHCPVIVGRDTDGQGPASLAALYPRGGEVLRSESVAEMVDLLVDRGVKRKDIAIAGVDDGDRRMSDAARQEFVAHWEGEWRRLESIQDELCKEIKDWVLDRNVKKYLWGFEGRDANKLEREKKLLGVWLPVWGGRVYPSFQFDGLNVRAGIEELLHLLPEDPHGWIQARWLSTPSEWLDECRPLDVVEGSIDAVIDAARLVSVNQYGRWALR